MHQLSSGSFWQSHLFASRRNRIILLTLMVISLVLGVASREAFATSPNEPINGCYNPNSGIIRHIGSDTCRANEIALSWPSMSDFIALQVALADEAAARRVENDALKKQIADLQKLVDDEITALKAADTTLTNALGAETTARITGDSQSVTTANTYTNTSVAIETSARVDMGNSLFGLYDSMVGIMASLMNGDFAGAWEAIKILAANSPAYQTYLTIGNVLGELFIAIQDVLAWFADLIP